jgi:cellulose synthase/poly-beta-1,6-N-acetylglucosamine synthase-like glycosyltransferase
MCNDWLRAMPEAPRVTVVMTAKGEPQERIERALASVGHQQYEGAVDLVIAAPPGDVHPSLGKVIDNPSGARSEGLNLATRAATGDVVVRLDARSVLPVDYVARCVARLATDPAVGVVGGVQFAVPASRGVFARGIARALRNPWATGGAAYRRVGASGEVDTVYLGVFRRAELLQLGGWDERLDANEDFDLCQRYRAAGQTVWLEEGLVVDYEPRRRLVEVWRQYVAFGRSKVRYWRTTRSRPGKRQVAALVAVPAVLLLSLRFPVVLVIAALGLVALDHVADPRERDLRVRAVSLVAYAPIVGGWTCGVVVELFARR